MCYHTSDITCRHLLGLYTGDELKCLTTDEQECEQLDHRLFRPLVEPKISRSQVWYPPCVRYHVTQKFGTYTTR